MKPIVAAIILAALAALPGAAIPGAALLGTAIPGVALAQSASPSPAAPERACPSSGDLALHDLLLPHARAAVANKHLTIMTMGGNASAGLAAHGPEFTYPMRLAARLQNQLPGIDVTVISRAALRRSASYSVRHLDEDLAQTGANLVIWGAGGIEAGMGVDLDRLADELGRGVDKIHAANADVIFMDLQYAPSIARVINLSAYRDTVLRVADALDVPILDRYALMQNWSDQGLLNFDVTNPDQRIDVARRLFDCLAGVLADGIAPAVRQGK